jgi:hypothetical protein
MATEQAHHVTVEIGMLLNDALEAVDIILHRMNCKDDYLQT